jgi:uncharacterized protein (DUF1501 family)
MIISRRNLLTSASAGAALTAFGPGLRVSMAQQAQTTGDILIVLFQRGACDWLQMLSPAGEANYIAARPSIKVPTSGTNAGLGLDSLDGLDFYMSPSAPELKSLYETGDLAFIQATGLETEDRSHFTCQDSMEKGVADGEEVQNSGWLTRHIDSTGGAPSELSVIASGSSNPISLLGESDTVAIASAEGFNVSGGNVNANIIRAMNPGGTPYQDVAQTTLDAVTSVQLGLKTVTDDSNGAEYTNGDLSKSLSSLAKLIKMNVGVNVATVDFGSWDMHNSLPFEFAQRTTEFSQAINAFWTDMADYHDKITLVTMTEFGRRLQENANQGTDHGSGSAMMVLSGNVNGGKIYGTWPGLNANQLKNGDLVATTDYRQVLSEILITRHGEQNLEAVFPTVQYNPLGFMNSLSS